MMKRQFLRVKQIADQKFQRPEKSEILTEELNAAEKKVELIKESCSVSGKKLSACTQRLANDSSDRRSVKKLPEAALAQCMEEFGLHLGENSILGLTLIDCARIQEALASDLLTYKALVEESVVAPLQNILKIDVSNITKYRKQLAKLISEKDSAKMKYQSAVKHCQQSSGNGSSAAVTKAQLLKEESEDSNTRVDQCRDALAAEMFNLISREPQLSQIFLRLCHLQLEYHRKALSILESSVPEIETQIRTYPYQPVFGCPLDEHLETSRREIAFVIETCICWLLESAMEKEGLFRIGGSMTKIKKMKSAFDAGLAYLIEEDRDPHNVAGVLKLYLRSLPEPLLTYHLYEDWMEAAMIYDHETRLQSLWRVVNSLPEANFKNLRYFIKFLARFCQNSDINKMSIQNIAIVIGPNLIWPQIEECALKMNMTATNYHSSIVETLITYADWFFPGECEFYVSTPTSPRHISGFPLSSSQLSLSTAKLSNGDSAVDSLSSSPTNSSPKSPSPRVPLRPQKKAAPLAPSQSNKNPITRSHSCGGILSAVHSSKFSQLSLSHENLLNAGNEYQKDIFQKQVKEQKGLDIEVRSKPPKSKPPRGRKSLPPVMERSHKLIERPSVPPPERPNSFTSASDQTNERNDLLSSNDYYNQERLISFTSSDYQNHERNNPLSSMDYQKQIVTELHSFNDYHKKEGCDLVSSVQDQRSGPASSISKQSEDISDSISSIVDQQQAIEIDNVSISIESSESDTYNECHMSFMDDSETEEEMHLPLSGIDEVKPSSALIQSNSSTSEKHILQNSLEQINSNSILDNVQPNSSCSCHDIKKQHNSKKKFCNLHSNNTRNDPFSLFHMSSSKQSPSNGEIEEENFDTGCHSLGGTPTWFEHYGEDKRQSNTIWFSNQNMDELSKCFEKSVFEETDKYDVKKHENPSQDNHFRTVIQIGADSNFDSSNNLSKHTVSGTAIKLRVNSETQYTRL